MSELVDEFDIPDPRIADLHPSFNVAPTDTVPGVVDRREPAGSDTAGGTTRQLRVMRWGLIPSWAKDPKIGARMINARSETIAERPAFKAAAGRRRCILPARGFFEWQTVGGKKLPSFLHDPDQPILSFAGLYELWPEPAADGAGRTWLWSCTIITRPAPDALGHIHDRTPVIVPADLRDDWLDCTDENPHTAAVLLAAFPEPTLQPYRVSTKVNNVHNNGPDLLEPETSYPVLPSGQTSPTQQ